MGFWSKTRKVIGHIVDVRVDRWCDLPWLKKITLFLWQQSKDLFRLEEAKNAETFEQAIDRLELTPELLAKQTQRYLILAFLFTFLTCTLLIYGVIVAFLKNWMGACICFSLTLYSASLTFRFYLWHFQITHQKLGCSLSDWYQALPRVKRIKQQ